VPFEDLWTAESVMSIGDHEVRVASIEHLLRMKADAGRAPGVPSRMPTRCVAGRSSAARRSNVSPG
jgi:hypothetical protein